jgi:hypothetical protein
VTEWVTKCIISLRQSSKLSKCTTVTADSLFENRGQLIDWLQDSIYGCMSLRQSGMSFYKQNLATDRHRVFLDGKLVISAWHDHSVVGNISTFFQLADQEKTLKRLPSSIPQHRLSIEFAATLYTLYHAMGPNLHLIGRQFGCRTSEATPLSIVSRITNIREEDIERAASDPRNLNSDFRAALLQFSNAANPTV